MIRSSRPGYGALLFGVLALPHAAIAQLTCDTTNILLDGGLELATGVPLNSPHWTEASVTFGSPICTVALCGTGGGVAGPRTGTRFAWFGGTPGGETSSLAQTVTIAPGTLVDFQFWLRIGAVTAPFTDVLSVKVDGDVIGSITEPVFAEGAYFQRIVVLDEFADGLPHEVKLEYVGPVGGGLGTFTVDDIRLVLWQVPVLLDGGLEATVGPPWSNPFWDETSIQVGTPLCGPGCPGAGPRSGDDWAWFGGIGGPLPEVSTISQSVRLPRAAFIDLDFWLWISSVSAPFTDVLNTRVDGVLVDSIAEPGAAGGGYTLRTDFLDAYADGGEHVLMLEYIKGASGNFASFNVDDISLEIFRCNAIHLDNFETHDLSNWTVVFP